MNFLSRRYWYSKPIIPTLQHSGAYSPGYAIDTPKQVINASVGTGEPSRLVSVLIKDKAMQNASLSLHFFQKLPTASITDNTQFDPADADFGDTQYTQFIGTVKIDSSNYYSYAGRSFATVVASGENGLLPFKTLHSASIYVQIVSDDAPTYTSTSDLSIVLLFDQDR